jgi:hypothetical protein
VVDKVEARHGELGTASGIVESSEATLRTSDHPLRHVKYKYNMLSFVLHEGRLFKRVCGPQNTARWNQLSGQADLT